MGVAQGIYVLLELVELLRENDEVGFLFIGRGSEFTSIEKIINDKKLENILIFDELPPSEIQTLYQQCHVGLVALDKRHTSHNIPGKFLSYLHAGLPTLAIANPGNELANIINQYEVGICDELHTHASLKKSIDQP